MTGQAVSGTAVLLLRLDGPLQSWGTDSKFETRATDDMPSKSGICGLLAAALGRPRDADVSDLAALKFGTRADREGRVLDEFQMARSIGYPDGQAKFHKDVYKVPDGYANLSHKHYLMDAVFLAGLEGDVLFLDELRQALLRPVYPLYLGRRCCPPVGPVFHDIRDGRLMDVLETEPMLCRPARGQDRGMVRYEADCDDRTGCIRRDVPVSYDPKGRTYGYRHVVSGYFDKSSGGAPDAEHDPMRGLPVETKGGE